MVFNRTYQLHAVKAAGGGHALAERVLAATEGGAFYRPRRPIRPGIAAVPCKNRRHNQLAQNNDQLRLPFAMSEEELAEEFERTFG